MSIKFEQFLKSLGLSDEDVEFKSKENKKNDAPLLEECVADHLRRVHGHDGPFTKEQQNKARQDVLMPLAERKLKELGLVESEGDETPTDNLQKTDIPFSRERRR